MTTHLFLISTKEKLKKTINKVKILNEEKQILEKDADNNKNEKDGLV